MSQLGDAAHPMLSFLGQGGNQAMEDGTVLGRFLGVASDVDDALTRYEADRKERANGVQIATRQRAEVLMTFSDAGSFPVRPMPAYDPAAVPV